MNYRRVRCVTACAATIILVTTACSGGDDGGDNESTGESIAPAPSVASAGLPAVPDIVSEIEPSVVTIRTETGLGSGIVYKADGTIVTSTHVIVDKSGRPFDTVEVRFADGTTSKAQVIATDTITDVGVIRAERDDLPTPDYQTSLPQVGEMVVVVGSPLGLTETVTAGIVSGLHRTMPASETSPQGLFDLIQVDAAISPGNSGGAVVNSDAEVIGLSTAYLPPSSGAVAIGFATPASTVTDVADQLLDDGAAQHAYVGIRPTEISQQLAERFGLPTTKGVLVLDVTAGGPAEKAGMRAGDIITSFAGREIAQEIDLFGAIRDQAPGDEVEVVVQRGDESVTLDLTLGDRSDLS